MGIKIAAVLLLGSPPVAVIVFEILLNATAMFNHGNVGLPPQLDRVFRLFVVTPDMHRIHHSVIPRETNSNFGFNLPWWDYLFGTYRDRPSTSQQTMTIGLSEYQENLQVEKLHGMLLLPFLRTPSGYAIDRDETK
jgi:sterol desaturase/sphingolipid hydroxylase (fatty acid hydroxylase superfamily)